MRAATEIARFDADVQRARDAVQPLARQLVPSHEWPFVFFHLRKAGGVLERCADTETVLRAYLPWLAPHYACENTTLNRGAVEDRKDAVVDADVEDVVLRQNALDEVAYKFGDEMLTLRLAQGQSYLKGAAAHKKGSPK